MNIPADASPNLMLGRSYDTESSSPGPDIFPSDIPTRKINVNKFLFKYQVVKNSKDVNDLLDVSGELSLKIKAGLIKVEGKGQYVNESKTEEGKTTLLAVMKCTTVTETIDGLAKPRDDVLNPGTHYVRSVTYGAEMVASLKFKTSTKSTKEQIKGSAEGDLSAGTVNVGLKAALDKLSSECNDLSDFQIKYFATELPDKLPVTTDELVELIGGFTSRMEGINEGQGVPIMFELQPIENILPKAKSSLVERVEAYDLEEMEERFDDLCSAQDLAKAYVKKAKQKHEDIKSFLKEAKTVERVFRAAISALGKGTEKEKVEASKEAYEDAIPDGLDDNEKFVTKWKEILSTKAPTTDIKLPSGDPLTVVLLGKTGNGKSATANTVIGKHVFKDSPGGTSETQFCQMEKRTDERQVSVIDTPGIMDTAPVSAMSKLKEKAKDVTGLYNQKQQDILREIYKIFSLSPYGLDAIIITIKYGGRFGMEDAEALRILQKFFGEEANHYMVLILTHGDQAVRNAKREKQGIEDHLKWYIGTLPDWVQAFLKDIGDRRLLFNNDLMLEENPDDYQKQLSDLIKIIDKMREGKGPFMHKLNQASKDVLDEEIAKAMSESGLNQQAELLRQKEEELKQKIADEKTSDEEKKRLEKELAEKKEKLKNVEDEKNALTATVTKNQFKDAQSKSGGKATAAVKKSDDKKGGCYPGSAMVCDTTGRCRRMDSLQTGEKVKVITRNEIQTEPVITFIHRQPEVMQEFLKITTEKNNILKITEDHLMFVEKRGQELAIPARDVKVGDTVYVRGKHGVVKDAVQSISSVYEKGVYAPVTLSGTILVNEVHTSCYFDVLSHDWSHRAMGLARAVHYVSPWMLQWISGVGEKDGFPGWCRLAHKMLSLMD